jgi:hypothetical protein
VAFAATCAAYKRSSVDSDEYLVSMKPICKRDGQALAIRAKMTKLQCSGVGRGKLKRNAENKKTTIKKVACGAHCSHTCQKLQTVG